MDDNRYSGAIGIVRLLKFLGVLMLLAGSVGALAVVASDLGGADAMMARNLAAIGCFIGGMIQFAFLWGWAELMNLAIDVAIDLSASRDELATIRQLASTQSKRADESPRTR